MNAPAHWLDERRAEARRRFVAVGLPHRRVEDWKYSDLKPIAESMDRDAAASWSVRMRSKGLEVFDLSNLDAPDWVRAHLGKQANGAMSWASLASLRRGFAVRVPGIVTGGTLDFVWEGEGNGRALFVVEDGASLTLWEANCTTGFSNIGVEIVLGANTRVTHLRTAVQNAAAVQVEEYDVQVGGNARYQAHLFNGGAKLSRAEYRVTLAGANAHAGLSGVSVLSDSAHADVTTHIIHAEGETQSTQLFKKVAGGNARGIYQGRITVAKGADKSDSRQTAKALLMGARAEADLKPELEIFADDVKCAHGAAVGDLDTESLFYLRSRGISEEEARNMLVTAFLGEVVDGIEEEDMRNFVRQLVDKTLPGAMVP